MTEINYEEITIGNSSTAGSMGVFQLRKTYEEVYPKNIPSFDFQSKDSILYGRMDGVKNIIHANEYYLKQIKSEENNNLFCLNFVADAFEDFRGFFKVKSSNKLLPDQFFTTNWDAVSAWDSPHNFYDSRMNDIYQVYVRGNLSLKGNENNIKSIDDFIKTFFNDFYPSMDKRMPITKSGLISSKYYNPTSTGLCIEIANDSHSLDYVKLEKFIKSPNFNFYLLTAAKFGFLVDKNAPWRLVANLNSPVMKTYMEKYDLTIDNIFDDDKIFIKTYKYDVQNMKVYIKQMYDAFISLSPTFSEKISVFSNEKCPTYKQPNQKLVERQKITQEAYDQKYSNLFWLKIYYRIKLDEIGVKQSSFLLTKELQKIEQIYNSLDFEQTLDYVNDRVKLQMNWA